MKNYTTTRRTENAFVVFFRIRHGTFPYIIEDDASTISQTPTIHYINTCVKLTIVTHLSFSERIAIANPSLDVKTATTTTEALSLQPMKQYISTTMFDDVLQLFLFCFCFLSGIPAWRLM